VLRTSIVRKARHGAKQRGDAWPFKRHRWPNYFVARSEYERGMSWEKIAAKHGVSMYGLRKRMQTVAEKQGHPWPFRQRDKGGGRDLVTTIGVAGEIREFRARTGMTFTELAELTGLTRSYLCRVATGDRNGTGKKSIKPMMDRACAEKIIAAFDRYDRRPAERERFARRKQRREEEEENAA